VAINTGLFAATPKVRPVPPIPSTDPSLVPPLSKALKTELATYMHAETIFDTGSAGSPGEVGANTVAFFMALPDKELIALYKLGARLQEQGDNSTLPGGANPPPVAADPGFPGLSTLENFLGTLLNPRLWNRVGEVVVGGILVAVGVNAMVRAGTHPYSGRPTLKSAKSGVGVAKVAHKRIVNGPK
jgi:hypothetical protein